MITINFLFIIIQTASPTPKQLTYTHEFKHSKPHYLAKYDNLQHKRFNWHWCNNFSRLLTEVQKDELNGVAYAPDSFYNPIQDLNDNWIISVEEIANTINPDTEWVKDLELIVYEPKPTPSPF